MDSTFKIGNKRALQESDFVPLSPENTTRAATEKLQSNWNKEKTKCRENGKKPRLWKSVLRMLSVKDIIIFSLSGAIVQSSNKKKMLLLSKHGLLKATTGYVIELLSNEVQRMEGETVKYVFLTCKEYKCEKNSSKTKLVLIVAAAAGFSVHE
ncbi:hypothetical protein pdam_00023393, partial [Pocillopora damicornis]